MKRSRYTRILVEGEASLLKTLVGMVASNVAIDTIRAPKTGLVMHKVRDAVSGRPFYLGELLATSCTVRIGKSTGYGLCLGENPEKAYGLAVVDAAWNEERPETKSWLPLLLEEERRIEARHQAEYRQSMQTRVRFETPDEYFNRIR